MKKVGLASVASMIAVAAACALCLTPSRASADHGSGNGQNDQQQVQAQCLASFVVCLGEARYEARYEAMTTMGETREEAFGRIMARKTETCSERLLYCLGDDFAQEDFFEFGDQ